MNIRTTLLSLSLLLVMVGGLIAQTPPANAAPPAPVVTTTTPNQPSTQDIENAKKILKSLTEDGKTVANTQPQGKTIGDVLDKGVDVFSGYVSTLEGVVTKYAPEVWRIMILQQYANAVAYPLFWGLLLLVIVIIRQALKGYFGMEKGQAVFVATDEDRKTYGYEDSYWARVWFVGIVPLVAVIPVTIIFLYNLTYAIMVFINPEYYALKDIIGLLR